MTRDTRRERFKFCQGKTDWRHKKRFHPHCIDNRFNHFFFARYHNLKMLAAKNSKNLKKVSYFANFCCCIVFSLVLLQQHLFVTAGRSCASTPKCNSLGLKGDCCPTPQNVFLECCGPKPVTPVAPKPSPVSPPVKMRRRCANNPACRKLGLKGQCCPTPKGVVLKCCTTS